MDWLQVIGWGFRMIMIFKKYGIQEDQLEDGIYLFFKRDLLEMPKTKF